MPNKALLPSNRSNTPRLGVAAFKHTLPVHFSQCDPAGIVFYPQYFVMLNNVQESWFNDGLGIGYTHLLQTRRIGLPVAHIETSFVVPSKMGDLLEWRIFVMRLGNASLQLHSECVGQGRADDLRLYIAQTVVFTSLASHRPIPIPNDIRQALEPYAPVNGNAA